MGLTVEVGGKSGEKNVDQLDRGRHVPVVAGNCWRKNSRETIECGLIRNINFGGQRTAKFRRWFVLACCQVGLRFKIGREQRLLFPLKWCESLHEIELGLAWILLICMFLFDPVWVHLYWMFIRCDCDSRTC